MSTTTLLRIRSWDRRHPVRDQGKVERLVESLAARGWDGPPIVVNSVTCEVYTGVHRLAALEALESSGADPIEIPIHDVEADFRGDDCRDSDKLAEALEAIDHKAAALVAAEGWR